MTEKLDGLVRQLPSYIVRKLSAITYSRLAVCVCLCVWCVWQRERKRERGRGRDGVDCQTEPMCNFFYFWDISKEFFNGLLSTLDL